MSRMTQKEIVEFFLVGSHDDSALVSLVCMGAGHCSEKIFKRLHKEANRILDGKDSQFSYLNPPSDTLSYWACDTMIDF